MIDHDEPPAAHLRAQQAAAAANSDTTGPSHIHLASGSTRAPGGPRRLVVAAIAGALAVLFLATPAFASGPPASSQVPGAALPIGNYTPGKPFSSGQVIQVEIPPNSVLTPGAGIKILECAAPGGAIPTDPSECDGETVQGDTVLVNKNGSVDYTRTSTTSGYTVYALPDYHSLGESKDGQPVCDASHTCVLFIGQNQLDFTRPHYWSQPFKVTPTPGDTGADPGDGALNPARGGGTSALLTIGLPIVVVVIIIGVLVLVRRRRATSSP